MTTVLMLLASMASLLPTVIVSYPVKQVPITTASHRVVYTAPPLVIVRTDDDFVYDAKEDWWIYFTGMMASGVIIVILIYVAYTYDIRDLCRKRQPASSWHPQGVLHANNMRMRF